MSLFSRRKKRVPDWASFLKPEEYKTFQEAVKTYFQSKKLRFEVRGSVLFLGNNQGKIWLGELGHHCKGKNPSQYLQAITDYLDYELLSIEVENALKTFGSARNYLGVAIMPGRKLFAFSVNKSLYREICEDVYEVVVVIAGSSVIPLDLKDAKTWNKTPDELFAIGREAVRKRYDFETQSIILGSHTMESKYNDFHSFAPNYVLELAKYEETIGENGMLVGIPNRYMMCYMSIESQGVMNDLKDFVWTIQANYVDHYQRGTEISDKLYWYQAGKFTEIPYSYQDELKDVNPPEEFISMMSLLVD